MLDRGLVKHREEEGRGLECEKREENAKKVRKGVDKRGSNMV